MSSSKNNGRKNNSRTKKKQAVTVAKPVQTSDAVVEVPQDILQKLDSQQQKTLTVMLQQRETFSGPIPHPAHLAEYERILPGSAERFMKQVEDEGGHRRGKENRTITSDIVQNVLAQIFSFCVILLGIGAGTYLTLQGHSGVGAAMIGTPVLGAAIAFLKHRKNNS